MGHRPRCTRVVGSRFLLNLYLLFTLFVFLFCFTDLSISISIFPKFNVNYTHLSYHRACVCVCSFLSTELPIWGRMAISDKKCPKNESFPNKTTL